MTEELDDNQTIPSCPTDDGSTGVAYGGRLNRHTVKLPLYTTTTIIKNRRAFSPLVRNHTPVRWMEAKEGGDVCRRVDTVSLDFQCFRNEIDDKRSQKRDLY
ncbi:hypothetical protein OUZ56_004546 [Daphnia magna]|uniref:Uncharacterized protein n=1 Tax=Daphnia magna TaxID=35525 RepID=A0ABQ9YQ69_9CRUS|nr:hypothetical protein OUZ56_004546 [Daphnia magna]